MTHAKEEVLLGLKVIQRPKAATGLGFILSRLAQVRDWQASNPLKKRATRFLAIGDHFHKKNIYGSPSPVVHLSWSQEENKEQNRSCKGQKNYASAAAVNGGIR